MDLSRFSPLGFAAGLFSDAINPNVDLIPGFGPNETNRRMAKAGAEVTQANSDPNAVFGNPDLGGFNPASNQDTERQASLQRAAQRADEQSYYSDQIDSLNRLLGSLNTQKDTGLNSLRNSFTSQKERFDNQRIKAMQGYDEQNLQNQKGKLQGVEQVDSFANDSMRNLDRILRGANAGNSSVARELLPYLVSKSAGQRRQGVFNAAGENERAIVSARGDAEDQFNIGAEDLENQRKNAEQTFLQQIMSKQNEIETERANAEIARSQASGLGYAQARAAAQGSRDSVNSRMAQLEQLFGQYQPTFNAKEVNVRTPELSRFTVDRAQIASEGQGTPAESSFYLSQLRRKNEERQ